MHYPHTSRRRSGTVLVWFAMLLMALLAVAALTIDTGLVRSTQRQIQSLADEAALEAAYHLNQTADLRQAAAQAAISTALSDTQTNDTQRFGAGPLIDLSGGIPVQDGFSAAQTLSINSPRVYQPTLAENAGNTMAGDIVQGTYSYPSSPPTPNPAHLEATDYSRPDFTPSSAGDSILVRLRRSSETLSPDEGTAGPPLPYLFGRGSLLAAQNKGQGVTVRATSIAAARPVLSAGPTPTAPDLVAQNIPGVAPFMLQLASWQAWRQQNQTATTLTALVGATGTISGNVSGGFTVRANGVTLIGQPFTPAGQTSPLLPLDGYVPLYDTIGGQNLVVGFLNAFDPVAKTGPTLSNGTLTIPISTAIAPGNASAALAMDNKTTNPLTGLKTADLSNLFSFTSNAVSSGSTDPLRAPALVR